LELSQKQQQKKKIEDEIMGNKGVKVLLKNFKAKVKEIAILDEANSIKGKK